MSAGLAAALLAPAVGARAQPAPPPRLDIRVGGEELLPVVYPDRYGTPGRLADDVDWVRDEAEDLVAWWEGAEGRLLLERVADLAGLQWRQRDIAVYLVRFWPVVSIEYPLVLALDAVVGPGGRASVPDDPDVRVLLLAHQLAHYLLDPPPPGRPRSAAHDHPLLEPGDFAAEAIVNWVVYRALAELWGEPRLDRATADPAWRAYNPSHDFVVDELVPRHRLSRLATLAEWLAANPSGSEIFRVREAYLRERAEPSDEPAVVARPTASEYGLDLGATHDGTIVVAAVDPVGPAGRVGVQEGDVLSTIEGRETGSDVAEAQDRLTASWEGNREINLSVERDGREIYFTIEAR